MKDVFTIGAFAIIFDDKRRILLCHRRDYDLWNLPGGRMEIGESPWECVLREVKEETGLDVEIEYLSGIYSKESKADLVISFVCKVIGGEIGLSDEADSIEYFAINEIPKNTSPKQVERIKDVLDEGIKKPVMKKQSGQSSIELLKLGKL